MIIIAEFQNIFKNLPNCPLTDSGKGKCSILTKSFRKTMGVVLLQIGRCTMVFSASQDFHLLETAAVCGVWGILHLSSYSTVS